MQRHARRARARARTHAHKVPLKLHPNTRVELDRWVISKNHIVTSKEKEDKMEEEKEEEGEEVRCR